MRCLSLLPVFTVLALAAAISACSPSKPPESPEGTSEPAAKDKEKTESDMPRDGKEAAPEASTGDHPKPAKPEVDKSLSLDTYEMTPSDCNALGRHYGEVARSDQMAGLSPKLTAKQKDATRDQIDKVVGKLEESWTNGCHASLVNKAVDHDAIKCALAAKTVKDFDVCLNGTAGTPQGKKKS